MRNCDHCTRRQFLTRTAAGATGLAQLWLPVSVASEQVSPLRVCVTSRCIFGGVVVADKDQADPAGSFKARTGYSFVMNEDCAGAGRGIEAVASGQADIGTARRNLTEAEKASGLVETRLGRVCYAVIVNKKNPLDRLTFEQVLKIFAGKIRNWREVGGNDFEILIYRQKCGANYDSLIDHALAAAGIDRDEERLAEATMSVDVTDTQLEKLALYEMAVTMAPRHFLDAESKHLSIDGIRPSADAERRGNYPLIAEVNLVSRKDAPAAVKQYVEFMAGERGRRLIERNLAVDWLAAGF